jgi:diacylglycerol O-acyltransferase
MKQLSGVDTSFLNLETATQFGHVASLIVLDPSTSKTGDIYADVRRMFDERLHLLEVYRRKLVSDPLGLTNPYWVDDPDMDLEFHLREIGLPAPGNERQLGEQVSRIIARPLDRTRPLWEWYVISGLADGNVAISSRPPPRRRPSAPRRRSSSPAGPCSSSPVIRPKRCGSRCRCSAPGCRWAATRPSAT